MSIEVKQKFVATVGTISEEFTTREAADRFALFLRIRERVNAMYPHTIALEDRDKFIKFLCLYEEALGAYEQWLAMDTDNNEAGYSWVGLQEPA